MVILGDRGGGGVEELICSDELVYDSTCVVPEVKKEIPVAFVNNGSEVTSVRILLDELHRLDLLDVSEPKNLAERGLSFRLANEGPADLLVDSHFRLFGLDI